MHQSRCKAILDDPATIFPLSLLLTDSCLFRAAAAAAAAATKASPVAAEGSRDSCTLPSPLRVPVAIACPPPAAPGRWFELALPLPRPPVLTDAEGLLVRDGPGRERPRPPAPVAAEFLFAGAWRAASISCWITSCSVRKLVEWGRRGLQNSKIVAVRPCNHKYRSTCSLF